MTIQITLYRLRHPFRDIGILFGIGINLQCHLKSGGPFITSDRWTAIFQMARQTGGAKYEAANPLIQR